MDTAAIIVTTRECYNYLIIKKKRIYSRVKSKQIPHYKIGGLIRLKKDEIDVWIEGQRIGATGNVLKGRSHGRNKPGNPGIDWGARA